MFAVDYKKDLENILTITINEIEAVLEDDDAFLYFENVKNAYYVIDKYKTVHGVCFELITSEKETEIEIDTIFKKITINKNGYTLTKELNVKLCMEITEIMGDNLY